MTRPAPINVMRFSLRTLPIAVCLCAILSGCGRPSSKQLGSLKSQVQPTIDAIENYKSTHGHYPVDLVEAEIELPEARYGGWDYRRLDNGHFQLSVGDYRNNGFVLFWSSKNQDWYLDT